MRTQLTASPGGRRGFTLIEIFVAVVIIILLLGMLIPILNRVHGSANKTVTMALMGNLQAGLQQYYSDFNMYPPSTPTIFTSGANLNRGSNMLAQGLMGYLRWHDDGAGPDNPAGMEPALGFRTRRNVGMGGGQVYGPYVSPDTNSLKMGYDDTDGINFIDQYFVDSWSQEVHNTSKKMHIWTHEILYYRSTRAGPGAPATPVTQIFGTGSNNNYFFNTADNAAATDAALNPIPSPVTAPAAFFALISSGKTNAVSGPVTGSSGYLLISAGLDDIYFTADDLVVGK